MTPDRLTDCAHCTCPRLDALEERFDELWTVFESFQRIERRQLQHARLLAARGGGTLVTRRDIQRMAGVTKESVGAWSKEPTFPPRVKIGTGSSPDLYNKAQVTDWLEEHYRKPKVRAVMRRKMIEQELAAEKEGKS